MEAAMRQSFKVVKISTKRKRQERLVCFWPGGVVMADVAEKIHRMLPWKRMEGIRTRGTGHGAMAVFRCQEEPDVCVELQGDSRKSPDEVLAMLAEHAQRLGVECTAMPAGTDMAAEAVCRRAGRRKVPPMERASEVMRPHTSGLAG
eukprot:TRINITY_DN5776_c0_g4_i1.p2 TRINITY_DN5776_c0_g4~~TRINITY_DN5776_c0_g4_i1.p2  ORF type:complete len:167 (+),score=28.83 TRINITY_DN5776_c0_g4_i1:62-502(+)